MSRVEIYFKEVISLAEQLSQTAVSIRVQAGEQTETVLNATRAVWKGESAELLLAKEVKVNEQMIKEAQILQNLSEELKTCATEMYLAECANSVLARTRIYL